MHRRYIYIFLPIFLCSGSKEVCSKNAPGPVSIIKPIHKSNNPLHSLCPGTTNWGFRTPNHYAAGTFCGWYFPKKRFCAWQVRITLMQLDPANPCSCTCTDHIQVTEVASDLTATQLPAKSKTFCGTNNQMCTDQFFSASECILVTSIMKHSI